MRFLGTKVSVIIPVANAEHTIERAINSCISQQHKNLEIIVVLNNSNLETINVVNKMEMESKIIKSIYVPVSGRSLARNIGLRYASGDYVQFLDADDELDCLKLKKSVEFLNNNPDFFGYCTAIKYFDELCSKNIEGYSNFKNMKLLKYSNLFPICSSIFRNESLKYFRDDMEYNEDWLFWYENILNKKMKIDREYFGGIVYITGENTTKNHKKMILNLLKVRIIIKKDRFDFNFFQKMKSDLRIVIQYMIINKSYKIDRTVKSNFFVTYLFAKLILRVPMFRNRLMKKFGLESSIYH